MTSFDEFPTLEIGSTGAWVVIVQCMLRDIFDGMFTVHIDGVFGKETQAAVYVIQQRNNITVDGIIGNKETWPALISEWWTLK